METPVVSLRREPAESPYLFGMDTFRGLLSDEPRAARPRSLPKRLHIRHPSGHENIPARRADRVPEGGRVREALPRRRHRL